MIVLNGVGNKPDQAEGLKDSSRWLRNEATTPPDRKEGDRKHPEGMPDIRILLRHTRVARSDLRSLQDRSS